MSKDCGGEMEEPGGFPFQKVISCKSMVDERLRTLCLSECEREPTSLSLYPSYKCSIK